MFNKSEIMKLAWFWFYNYDETETSVMDDYVTCHSQPTFAQCLKAAWAKAKEDLEYEKEEAERIATSEELKAWNWAERKLNVKFDLTDSQKFWSVMDECKNMWRVNCFAAAINAVKMEIENNVNNYVVLN